MEDQRLGAGSRLSLSWQAGETAPPIDTLDHVASYTKALVDALTAAGWQPRRLDVALRLVPPRAVELSVHGDVPQLDQANFARLASVAIATCNLWAALDNEAEIRLRPRLFVSDAPPLGDTPPPPPPPPLRSVPAFVPPPAPPSELPPGPVAPAAPRAAAPSAPGIPANAAPPAEVALAPEPPGEPPPAPDPPTDAAAGAAPPRTRGRSAPKRTDPLSPAEQADTGASAPENDAPRFATRLIVALVFGGLLGLFGLPRLSPQFELPTLLPAAKPLPTVVPTFAPVPAAAQNNNPTLVQPTEAPTPQPTPAAARASNSTTAATPPPTRVLFAERFVSRIPGWPHDPAGTAWFADGTYQMAARAPGRFVAIGAPIGGAVSDAVLSARFRKTGGPAGGGYGFILRNQGTAPLDGENQQGRYVVLEVGDQGDVGIWQRDEARWVDVLPWTRSNAVRPGTEANELSVTSQGRRLQFVVNGIEVANFTHDGLPPEGGVGIFVGGDLNEVSLEWLIVEAPGALVAR